MGDKVQNWDNSLLILDLASVDMLVVAVSVVIVEEDGIIDDE